MAPPVAREDSATPPEGKCVSGEHAINVIVCHSAHYPILFRTFLPGLLRGAAAFAGETVISRRCLLMVLEERLAVMNSIHQSESYTALLSFSVKFCLRGRPEPVLLPR